MARYHIAHFPRSKTWMCKNEDGAFFWYEGDDAYKKAHKFDNYKQARAALDTLPDEKLMYGESYKTKCHFMKSYDSDEQFKQEQAYLENKRTLRSWGY
jgi:hypothetical protein